MSGWACSFKWHSWIWITEQAWLGNLGNSSARWSLLLRNTRPRVGEDPARQCYSTYQYLCGPGLRPCWAGPCHSTYWYTGEPGQDVGSAQLG